MSLQCHLSKTQSVTITHNQSKNFWGTTTYTSFNAESDATGCSGKNYSIDTGRNGPTWTTPWFENSVILASNKKWDSKPHKIACRESKLPDVKISGDTFTFYC